MGCGTLALRGDGRMTEQIEAVQRMQEYIELHLDEEIRMAQLAEVAFFSPWYAYRLFRQHTGVTPAEYQRRLRLSRSALQLRSGQCTVTQAAMALGFGSVDGYQRAFLRTFGCNPAEYAAMPRPLPLFIPYGVKYQYLRKEPHEVSEVRTVFVQRVEKPARRVVLKRGATADNYWSYCAEVGCEVWGILASLPSLAGEPVCLWLPQKYRTPGTSAYVQGVELADGYDGPLPEGFDLIRLPAASYLMFQGAPFAEEDYSAAVIEVQRAMQEYHPETLGLAWDDENPRIQLEPMGRRGYIELRAVRPLACGK